MGRCLVILPSFNSGAMLPRTMLEARRHCDTVWAVVDGSTDGSAEEAGRLGTDGFRVIQLAENSGKGGAAMAGFRKALRCGFTHALLMDADGQHDAACIPKFLDLSQQYPAHLIAGVPIFGADAPAERVEGRRVGNFFATLETWGMGPADSLFGMRLYPIRPSLEILGATRTGRGFDFDTVLAVRLVWSGIRVINLPVPVRYPPRREGGVTHFRYIRDNLLLTTAHVRLVVGMLFRIPRLLSLRIK